MLDEKTDGWPRFKIVTYSRPTGIPNGWDAELLENGAPDGIMVEALQELVLLEDPGSGPLICFGAGHLSDMYVCLDPCTKQVVDILYGAFERGNPQVKVLGSAHQINSSLDKFIASVHAVTDRFPYDSWRPGEELAFNDLDEKWAYEDKIAGEWDKACREMIEMLRKIDPAAIENMDGFWMMFIAGAQMGIYSTRNILNSLES